MPRKFDLNAEAMRLFTEARARGDAAGATSVLKFINDLSKGEPKPPSASDGLPPIAEWTEAECEVMVSIVDQLHALKARVAARAGVEYQSPSWPDTSVRGYVPPPVVAREAVPEAPTVEAEPLEPDEFIGEDGNIWWRDPDTGEAFQQTFDGEEDLCPDEN